MKDIREKGGYQIGEDNKKVCIDDKRKDQKKKEKKGEYNNEDGDNESKCVKIVGYGGQHNGDIYCKGR